MTEDIHDRLLDGDDDEYRLGGLLLGTVWHDEDGIYEVRKVRHQETREEGMLSEHPEIILSNNRRFRVKSFKRRIDPYDIGDLEPSNHEARKLIEVMFRD